MAEQSETLPSSPKANEFFWVVAILLAFLAISLAVATLSPTVSGDEAGYTDPSANAYFGAGFTSTMWGQERHEFWCGNVPLYQFILLAWFKLFGFGFFQARAVNDFLTAAAALFIWAGVGQAGIIKTARWRLLCVLLVLSGSVSTLTFRTVRPDATMFFVCAAVFFLATLPPRFRARSLLVALAACLLPVAGIPMLPYLGLWIVIWAFCFGTRAWRQFAAIGLGFAGGIGLLILFYSHFASLKLFVDIVLPFTALGGGSTGGGGQSLLSRKIWGDESGGDNLFTCFFGKPTSTIEPKTLCDFSAVLLFALFLILALRSVNLRDPSFRRKVLFVILFTLIVPPVMHFAGHYRSYYRWMTYIPLCVAVPWVMESEWAGIAWPNLKRLAWAIVCVSLLLGVPVRSLVAAKGWKGRSVSPLEQAAAGVVRTNDIVVCDRKFWFAIRPHANLVYICNQPARGAFDLTVDLPTNQISLLCLSPEDYDLVTKKIGGNWIKLPDSQIPGAETLKQTRYAADFYRRSD